MERYFFDIEDGYLTTDIEGKILDGADAVTKAAMKILLEVAKFEVVTNNECELSVTVRDVTGRQVYRASLTVRAGWLASSGSTVLA